MSDSTIPTATYRLQFNANFRFSDAAGVVDYLADLGITDVYASPILTSRKGSTHGYDVTDPTQIDPEIGSPHEFEELENAMLKRGMRLILDIVPNHMAASRENRWWMDVLENGSESGFASYFDIDWHPPSRNLEGKVLLPVLGRPFGEALDRGDLRLLFEGEKFFVQYFELLFPLTPRSYRRLLKHHMDELRDLLSEESPAYQEYSGIIAALSSLQETAPSQAVAEKRVRLDAIRERLQRLIAGNPDIAAFINANIADFNGLPGDTASLCPLERLLGEQNFLLAYWQDPNEGINYRRFFTITDLVGVRAEDPIVFEATHDQILHLASKGVIRGLRIDHIDGLRDPLGYLTKLQERLLAFQPPESGPPFVLVEKILSRNELLPDDWPVSGTTGYEYLNAANGLHVNPIGASKLEKAYFNFIGKEMSFAEVIYEKKKLVMHTMLRVEMQSLGRQLAHLASRDRYARDLLRHELMEVLIESTACLPVYRTFIRNLEVPDAARQLIEGAIEEARKRRPRLIPLCFDFLRDVLTLANPPHILSDQREERLAFVMRWQQFTGPIVAKGLEDTALYAYYPLLSLNEVGGSPEPSAIMLREDFYDFLRKRQERWPSNLNATSTHDTKRSEDVRARLNVLSEVPELWTKEIAAWSAENEACKPTVDGRKVPDANEEYLIYQTLVGLWPADPSELPSISARLQAYVIKAIREAMVHTRWTEPNTAHEQAVCRFIERILSSRENAPFLSNVAHFLRKIVFSGMLNGISQTLLKITCPGVPDFYQGSELWDFHLVDPDNRGPVDFRNLCGALQSIVDGARANRTALAAELLAHWPDGRIKLYVIWKALGCRRKYPALFEDGEFLPVEVMGDRSEHIISFLRRREQHQVLVVIPRWVANFTIGNAPVFQDFLKETHLKLALDSPHSWSSVFTGSTLDALPEGDHRIMSVGKLLNDFPIALLTANPQSGE